MLAEKKEDKGEDQTKANGEGEWNDGHVCVKVNETHLLACVMDDKI